MIHGSDNKSAVAKICFIWVCRLMTDYKEWNIDETELRHYIISIRDEFPDLIGNNLSFDHGCFILNNNKIFKPNHWKNYNNQLYQRDDAIPRSKTIYIQKYKNLMFKLQKYRKAPKNWKNFETRPSDKAVYGWKLLFENGIMDVKGLYFNKGHIIAAELLPYSTRFKVERHMNFVPLTNWANRANSDKAKGMQFFESKISYWIKNISSSEKIFYRVTPVFLSHETIPRAIILEAKLIKNTSVYSYKIKNTEFNVLSPNVQSNLEIDYGNPAGYKIIDK